MNVPTARILQRTFRLLLCIGTSGLVFARSPVTNHLALPMPALAKPQVASFMVEPVFGSSLFRLTDATAARVPGSCPQYAKRQAWNVDESLLLVTSGEGAWFLYDGVTYQFKRTVPDVAGEDVFWHPTRTNIVLYNAQNTLYAHDVFTDEEVQVCAITNFYFANTAGEGNISRDGRYYAVYGRDYEEATGRVIPRAISLWDLSTSQEVSRLPLPDTLNDFDWVSVSPLGSYVVVDYATELSGAFQGVEVYDRSLAKRLWQKPLGSGHSDLGIDASGEEVLVIGFYDANSNQTILKKFRLRDGEETTLLTMDWSFYLHVSCANEQRSEWCFVSTYDGVGRLTDSPATWLPFEDEIFAVKLDGSQNVQRLAHHRSRRFSPTTPDSDTSVYWAEPHATVSRKGDRILFGSNWRDNIAVITNVDAYICDFRSLVAHPRRWEAAGFGAGGYFPHLAVDPADSRTVYLASDVSGLNKSTNYGESWFKINSGLNSREVSYVAIDRSNTLRLWAATPLGLYSSTNGGAGWSLASPDITSYKHVNHRSIAISAAGTILTVSHRLAEPADPPESGNLVGELYRSIDRSTWTLNAQLADEFSGTFRRFPAVVYDPAASNQVFLLVDEIGVLKSTDDGVTWSYFTNGLPLGASWRNLEVGSNLVYLTGVPSLVYRSPKTSAAWEIITNGLSGAEGTDYPTADAIRVSPGSDETVYLGQAGWPYILYRSVSGGGDWIGSPMPEAYSFDLQNAPFETWNNPFQAPVSITIDPSDPRRVYCTTWFAPWRSDDRGTNWTEKVSGAQNTICTDLLSHRGTLYATHMDVGLYRSANHGNTWLPCVPKAGQNDLEVQAWSLVAGPGGEIYAGITMLTPGSTAKPAVCRSVGGGNWEISTNGIPQPAGFDLFTRVTMAADARPAGAVYLAVESFTNSWAIHRSTDLGKTWLSLPAAPGSAGNDYSRRVKALAVDENGRLFAGLYWDGLWHSDNGGHSWTASVGNQVDLRSASVQEILPLPGGTVLAALDNGLYKSVDRGQTFSPIIRNVNWGESSLEYIHSVAIDPADSNQLFLSTAKTYPTWVNEGSVWRSRDGGLTWADLTADLPVKPVVALAVEEGYLYAATWGANVYRTDIDGAPPRFRIAGVALDAAGRLLIRWPSSGGQSFTLLMAESLAFSFVPIAKNIPASPPENVKPLETAGSRMRFYQVLIEP